MARVLLASVTVLYLALASTAGAQEPPRFDVASIRPHRAADDLMFALQFHDGGRLTATATLRMLIRTAYRLQDFQIVTETDWIDNERFDIDARAAGPASPDEMRLMLRELLRDRFGLALRQERREVAVYALRTMDGGGKFGSRLGRSPADCAARPCGLRLTPAGLTARGVTMAMLANELSARVDRIVTDHTGLEGEFDVDLDWTPYQLQAPALLEAPAPPIAIEPDWPSLFTSLREQLGLSLVPARDEADVAVIAGAHWPEEN